ncbi:MAG: hypothetical protein JKX71_12215 [Amylibacter sp.]|nr:hypothetical protein [Amylibacter sp.]
MKQGLIIGNSHVAMIAKFWHANPDHYPDMNLTFMAQPGLGPKDIQFDGTVMYSTDPDFLQFQRTLGTKPRVDLEKFDFLVIVACGLSFYPLAGILRSCHVWGWDYNTQNQLISSVCLQTALMDSLQNTYGAKLVKTIRRRTAIPIYIVPQPLPSEQLSILKQKGGNFRKIDMNGINQQAYQAYETALEDAFSPHKNTTIIFQPKETIKSNIYTRSTFTKGAVRLYNLNKQQPETDILHANQDYGGLILGKLTNLI